MKHSETISDALEFLPEKTVAEAMRTPPHRARHIAKFAIAACVCAIMILPWIKSPEPVHTFEQSQNEQDPTQQAEQTEQNENSEQDTNSVTSSGCLFDDKAAQSTLGGISSSAYCKAAESDLDESSITKDVSFSHLIEKATLVVRGVITEETGSSFSNPDGTVLNQLGETLQNSEDFYYSIQVDEVYAGELESDTVTVKTRRKLPNIAEGLEGDEIAGDAPALRLKVGKEAILFLIDDPGATPMDQKESVYLCLSGDQGIFYRTKDDGDQPVFQSTKKSIDIPALKQLLAEQEQ